MTEFVSGFHFLRPWWLLAVPVVMVLWRRLATIERAAPCRPANMAPHLFAHLLVNHTGRFRVRAVDLLAGATLLLVLAAAGPTWWRQQDFQSGADETPLVIVLNVSRSMLVDDVKPNRLTRARHSLLDLLTLHAGRRVALVAYAGSAHLVLPFTDDPAIIKSFVDELTPDVMPVPGRDATAAAALASQLLARAGTRGTVLFMTDGIDALDIPAFERQRREGGPDVIALIVGNEGRAAPRASGASDTGRTRPLDSGVNALDRWRRAGGVEIVHEEAGEYDVRRIDRAILSNAIRTSEGQAPWDDRGELLLWPAALLLLACCRRGWSLSAWPSACVLLVLMLPLPSNVMADPWDTWLTPDQRGRLAYERRDYAAAARLFEDPTWKGIALYRVGRYQEAAAAFARVPTPDGLFNRGNALLKTRQYVEARAAYRQVLKVVPDHAGARHNLRIAIAIIARLTDLRSESGEEGSAPDGEPLSAQEAVDSIRDEVVDERTMLGPEASEQWMRLVETRVADFLRSRFALEAASGKTP